MRFSDTLDRRLEEIKRPPNLPIGDYVWQITKYPTVDSFEARTSGEEWEKVTFFVTCVSAHEDVDPDLLAEYGDVAGAMNQKVFMFNTSPEKKADFERVLFNLKQFLATCGVTDDELPLNEAFAQVVGAQFLGELKHRPDPNDPEVVFSEIGRTAAV